MVTRRWGSVMLRTLVLKSILTLGLAQFSMKMCPSISQRCRQSCKNYWLKCFIFENDQFPTQHFTNLPIPNIPLLSKFQFERLERGGARDYESYCEVLATECRFMCRNFWEQCYVVGVTTEMPQVSSLLPNKCGSYGDPCHSSALCCGKATCLHLLKDDSGFCFSE